MSSGSTWLSKRSRYAVPSGLEIVEELADQPSEPQGVAADRNPPYISQHHNDTMWVECNFVATNETSMFTPTITASQIPRFMADDDGRGRVVELRELCKQWAHTDHAHRVAMVAAPPSPHRRYHRFTRRRHDLARIAAVVHALCDRDDVPVPSWVWEHRSRRHRGLCETSVLASSSYWRDNIDAPDACAYHRVWFDPASIENHTIHGFTSVG